MTMPDSGGVQEVVRAKRFELVDDDGAVRGEMSVGSDGPILALLNRNGMEQWGASVSDRGSDLYLSDRAGESRLSVSVNADGTPDLVMYDQNRKLSLLVYLDDDGTPNLTMSDQNGNSRLSVSLYDDGTPNLTMSDQNGVLRLAVWVYGSGTPSVDLWDENGNAISR